MTAVWSETTRDRGDEWRVPSADSRVRKTENPKETDRRTHGRGLTENDPDGPEKLKTDEKLDQTSSTSKVSDCLYNWPGYAVYSC